jgi:hypothetical protein
VTDRTIDPVEEPGTRPRRPRWLKAAVAAVVAFELTAAAVLVTTRTHEDRAATAASPRPAATRPRADSAERHVRERAAAVTAVLARRAAAIRTHDRAAFLATLDAGSPAFVRTQLAMLDALRRVPLSSWRYELSDDRDVPPESHYLARYDVEAWSPRAVLRYQLTGFDDAPTAVEQFFTFVHRGAQWLTASDTDFPDVSDRQTGRDLWDFGTVEVVNGARSLVLGHPGHATLLRDIARQTDAAVPRVTAVWGSGWARRAVVVVPDTQQELAAIIGDSSDLSRIAAVAVAELPGDTPGSHPVGNRVIVNPPNFRKLGPNGRRVVLTHEVTHVATRNASGPGVPTWLVEGFADYVGYLGTGLSTRAICQELANDVRHGRRPAALPTDDDFSGRNARLAQAYEAAWLAVTMIAERVGRAGLVAFYNAAGTAGGNDPLRDAMGAVLHTTPETFTAAWRTYVVKQLA